VLNIYRGDKFKIIIVIAIFVILVLGLIALTNMSSNILTGLHGYIAAAGFMVISQQKLIGRKLKKVLPRL